MSASFAESVVEDAALAWLEALGYAVLHGPDIAAGELSMERSDPNYRDVVLERRVRDALVLLESRPTCRSPGRCLSQNHARGCTIAYRTKSRLAQDARRWGNCRIPPK